MIRTCLFPVAGYGTRFLPATKAIPKEMLPILTRPLIEYAVSEAQEAGCDRIAMVTSKYKKAIEDHFDTHTDIDQSIAGSAKESLFQETKQLIAQCTFTYTRQLEMKGLGHAILTGEPLIGDLPFAVILPDDLCTNGDQDTVLGQMVKLYERYGCSIVAIEEVSRDQTDKYGVIAGELIDGTSDTYRVTDMVEKPEPKDAPTNMAIIGRYILTPDIFDILRSTPAGRGGEIQITDALLQQAKQGRVIAYKFKGRRFDCGSVDGFVEATNYFYSKGGL